MSDLLLPRICLTTEAIESARERYVQALTVDRPELVEVGRIAGIPPESTGAPAASIRDLTIVIGGARRRLWGHSLGAIHYDPYRTYHVVHEPNGHAYDLRQHPDLPRWQPEPGVGATRLTPWVIPDWADADAALARMLFNSIYTGPSKAKVITTLSTVGATVGTAAGPPILTPHGMEPKESSVIGGAMGLMLGGMAIMAAGPVLNQHQKRLGREAMQHRPLRVWRSSTWRPQ